jgi:transposase
MDKQWTRLRRVPPPQKTGPRSVLGDRLFIEAVLFRAKTGLPLVRFADRFGPNHRMDRRLYRQRYLVEIFFHRLKRFRAIATRYEKTARNYLALVQVSCAWLWLS